MLSTEQLLEQIDGSLQELTTIFDQAFQGGQVDLGWKRLESLTRRIARLIAEEVSEDEALAFQFQSGVDVFSDLGDEIDKCRNSLVALSEELRSHPEIRTRHRVGRRQQQPVRRRRGQMFHGTFSSAMQVRIKSPLSENLQKPFGPRDSRCGTTTSRS